MNTAEAMVDEETRTTPAWLLSLRGGFQVSIGHDELRHLLIEPPTYKVPHAPRFCHSLVSWEERLLPLYELAEFMGAGGRARADTATGSPDSADHIYAVVGFNLGADTVDYGAIGITEPPMLINVSDDDVSPIDEQLASRKMIVKTNFRYRDSSVPIINIKYLFTGVFSG